MFWKESEISKIRAQVHEIEENFDDLEIKFKDPLFSVYLSPIKIEYRGKKLGIFARNVYGTIKLKKKNGNYVVDVDSVYDLRAHFKKDTKLHDLSREKRDLVHFEEENGRQYLKNETIIHVMEPVEQTDEPDIEKYLQEALNPLEN